MDMRKIFVGIALTATATAAATAGAQEQRSIITGHAAAFEVSPYVGYMRFGALNEYDGNVRESFDNRPVYGAQAGLAVTRNLSVVGNFGYSRTRPVLKSGASATAQLPTSPSDVGVWLYDANAEYRLPVAAMNGIVRPFVQAGAGQIRYSTAATDIRSRSNTSTALNAGAGVDVQLGTVGLRVMAKDYLTSLDWDRADDVTLRNRASRRANNIALTAGLKVGF
jgi:hypothetical protein